MAHIIDDNNEFDTTIEDLPCVVLEYILSHLSPYKELIDCKLVSKSWRLSVISTISKLKREFSKCLNTCGYEWHHLCPSQSRSPSISPRYSHSGCCFGDSLYIFGGCTIANTTFNDLWRFDLSCRSWIRPISTGTFPSPKACASLCNYRHQLILYGGWTHSSPYPIHQEWRIFNHIHSFDTIENRWNLLVPKSFCPALAGHSASIIGHQMIIFGGLRSEANNSCPFSSCNDIWVINLLNLMCHKQLTSNMKPLARYGHSQIVIDETHLLIIGGSGGPNMLFSDIWLLTMTSDESPWLWTPVDITDKHQAIAPQFSFHPACKIGNVVVILNANQKSRSVQCKDGTILRKPSIRNHYVPQNESPPPSNPHPVKLEPKASTSTSSSSDNFITPMTSRANARRNRQRQLEGLDRMEQRIRQQNQNQSSFTPLPLKSATIKSYFIESNNNPMQLFSLDISEIVEHKRAKWLHQQYINNGPEDTILYSLVAGRAEIIMFGGIQKDKNLKQMQQQDNAIPDIVSNHLHIISAKRKVI